VPFSEAIEESLVLPEPRDTVRELVMQKAREQGLEPTVAFQVRSIPAMRSLIARGVAAGILPLAAVADDVRAGRLAARRIVAPSLRRTLYLAWLVKRSPPRSLPAIAGVIRSSLHGLTELLGPLAEPAGP
jgi:LysR family nitrogen assimilation transcriptional regulator